MRAAAIVRALVLAGSLLSAGAQATDYAWRLPGWLPLPVVPDDNPMTAEKVELGRHLFYDRRLSRDGSMSCASCHVQALAFADGRPRPVGVTGEVHPRNAQALVNVAYTPVLTWANPSLVRIETQVLIPLFGEHPVEMGMAGREEALMATLRAEPRYAGMFERAFPAAAEPIGLATLTRALASFVRALVSADSPYDRYRYGGQRDAISDAAKRGEGLFFSERLECFHCHGGFNFTDSLRHRRSGFTEIAFHNNGLYDLDGNGRYPAGNTGVHDVSGKPEDMGRFRTPSLRNIAVTAPYMHDGSLADLDAVIDHYARGGRHSPLQSQFVRGFELTAAERADLKAFLHSLTDAGFLADPRFTDPFASR